MFAFLLGENFGLQREFMPRVLNVDFFWGGRDVLLRQDSHISWGKGHNFSSSPWTPVTLS